MHNPKLWLQSSSGSFRHAGLVVPLGSHGVFVVSDLAEKRGPRGPSERIEQGKVAWLGTGEGGDHPGYVPVRTGFRRARRMKFQIAIPGIALGLVQLGIMRRLRAA